MLYMGYLIVLNGRNIKKTALEISIFAEAGKLHKQVVPWPPWDPPPKHPNRVKTT